MNNLGIPVLSIITYLPLLGALAILLLARNNDRATKWVALATTGLAFLFSIWVLLTFDASMAGMQFVEQVTWLPQVGIEYFMAVDGISVLFVFLTGLLSVIAIIASWDPIKVRVKEYYILLLLLETGMFGVFMALDFFVFYVFWEIVLIPMALLIAVWGGGRRIYSAIKFFLYTLAGSLLMLVAIIALYFQHGAITGTYTLNVLELAGVSYAPLFQMLVFAAFFLAFAIKVPLFPFHTWLPDAHVDAPTAGSVILAGILLKMGGYGFLRFALPILPDATMAFAPWIIGLSIVAILYGAYVTLVQKDLKKLIAYSSVSHMGFVMLGIFVFNVQGLQGAIIQMFSHGLVTGGLFLVVGVIYERLHTRQIAELGGVASPMPTYGALAGIFMLASMGLPGLSGFVGEFLVLVGIFKVSIVLAAVTSLVIIVSAAYMLWMFQRVFFTGRPKDEHPLMDITWREGVTLVPLAVLTIFVGLYPVPILNIMAPAVDQILQQLSVNGPIVSGLFIP